MDSVLLLVHSEEKLSGDFYVIHYLRNSLLLKIF